MPLVSYCADGASNKPVDLPDRSSPAYTGRGPHLLIYAEMLSSISANLDWTLSQFSLPSSWVSRKAHDIAQDVARAQLVLCLTDIRQTQSKPIGRCRYDITTADVYPVVYTFQLFEVKTGRQVAKITLHSDDPAADDSCNAVVNVRIGQRPAFAQNLLDATLRPALRSYVLDAPH